MWLVTPIRYDAKPAQAFESARLECQLKYETLASWAEISRARLHQILTQKSPLGMDRLQRIAENGGDDGRMFVACYLNHFSLLTGVRHWDGIAAALVKLTAAVADGMRMAKAPLTHLDTRKQDDRRIA